MRFAKGFTLVEIIVYITLVSILALVFTTFSFDVIGNAQKSRLRQELQQNARFAMDRITQEVRTSTSINTGSSTFGSHPGVLSVGTSSGGTNPTIFDVSSGVLRIKQGAGAATALTDSRFTVSNFVVENLSVSSRTTHVRISLTISSNLAGTEYNDQVSIVGSAQVRVQSD